MPEKFPALSSPFSIGKVTIKNRFVMAPVTTGTYLNPDGSFSPSGIEYFVRRAQGGMGLLQTGARNTDTEVDPYSALDGAFRTAPDAFLATSDAMLTRTRAYGARFFVQLTLGMNSFISAQGFSTISMMTVCIGAVTNIILDPIFIFVFNMGVAGAAWATIISQALSALWAVWILSKGKSILRLKKENLRIDMKVLAPCIALGVAPFAMQATESVLVLCFNSSLLRYGGDLAVGAMTILSSVMQFAMLPLQGLTQGGQPIISYNYGAMQAQRVKKAFRLQTIACFTYSSLLWAAVELCPSSFVAIFTNEPQLSEITVWALRIYMAAVLLMGIQVSCQQTFIAFGNSKISAFLAVFRKIIVLIPLIFILPQFMQDDVFAVFLAEPIADTIAVITTATLFAFEFKKVMRKMQEDAHPASA